MKEPIIIAGCGDIGLRVAVLALAAGHEVAGLVRSAASAARLRTLGAMAVTGDLDDSTQPVAHLPSAGATVIYTVPPPGGGEYDPRVRVFCGSIEPGEEPRTLVYLSTTGVYGDQGGAVVTEATPPRAETSRAKRRLDAEQLLLAWGAHRQVRIVILRVAGIYGPGRLPLNRIQEGCPVLRDEDAPYTSRIHADDLARICLAAAAHGEHGEIFNICDGEVSTMTDYFNAVADAFNLPRPAQVDRDEAKLRMPPLLYSYFGESRRIDNQRMRERLQVRLQYPDLPSGLAASKEKRDEP